ncbi:MAG: hypothetical protein R2724_04000 [Bryobacterales bacterium]
MSSPAEPARGPVGRRFAFYPAIRNVEHNEWTLEGETWSEILAKNVETGQELWIPRNHLGEVSSSDSPVLIVGLKRELEQKAGTVFPFRNPVVQMPGKPTPRPSADEGPEPEPPPPNRDSSTEAHTLSLIGKALVIGLVAAFLITVFAMGGFHNPIAGLFQPDVSTADQRYLALTNQDAYHDVVAKMGKPEREEWLTKDDADLQFQALFYPSRRYVLILMGGERGNQRYIGALHDPERKVLDSARLSGGGDASAMMKNLPEF